MSWPSRARSTRVGLERTQARRREIVIVCALCAAALVSGCGKGEMKEDSAKKLDNAGKQMEQAAKELEDAAKKGGKGMADAMAKMGVAVGGAVGEAAKTIGTAIEPVDFRELKALLPAGIGAMKRVSSEGEKGGGFGIVVAHAEGRYEGDGGNIELKITDPGNLSGFAAMAAMWMNMELDKETDTGYEKTGTANGRRFHEKYDKSAKSGEYTKAISIWERVLELDPTYLLARRVSTKMPWK